MIAANVWSMKQLMAKLDKDIPMQSTSAYDNDDKYKSWSQAASTLVVLSAPSIKQFAF